jgi:hypothetical protein|tara:strand:+ start:342 stop:506 length:165 start_codon:yes stop_codon:yes gene_type:complete
MLLMQVLEPEVILLTKIMQYVILLKIKSKPSWEDGKSNQVIHFVWSVLALAERG